MRKSLLALATVAMAFALLPVSSAEAYWRHRYHHYWHHHFYHHYYWRPHYVYLGPVYRHHWRHHYWHRRYW
jgi:hypothetical protein